MPPSVRSPAGVVLPTPSPRCRSLAPPAPATRQPAMRSPHFRSIHVFPADNGGLKSKPGRQIGSGKMRKPTRTSAQRWASLSPTGRFSDWQTLCNAELHGDASNYSSGRDGRMSTTISRAKNSRGAIVNQLAFAWLTDCYNPCARGFRGPSMQAPTGRDISNPAA